MSDDTKKANPQLEASRFTLSEQVRNAYTITTEAGISREQILHPDFWGAIAAKLRPYDRIEVRCDDGTLFAELLVLAAERTFARVRVLAWHDLTTRDVAQSLEASREVDSPSSAYEVRHSGPHLKFCVVRLSDGARIREKEPTRELAEVWLKDYLRATAAA